MSDLHPSLDFKPTIKVKNGKNYILDILRRKYVRLTPEEFVRQNFIHFLISLKKYPKQLLANEISIKLNNTEKRCDTIVYNKYLEPLVIIEYKSPNIEITTSVFEQILRYNMALHVKYLMISNGKRNICCEIDYDKQQYIFLKDIPNYSDL